MAGTSFNGIPVLSLAATIGSTPVSAATLPWNGLNKAYQWTATFSVTSQSQSGVYTRQKFQYNGLDVNVGMWIANLTSGLAWQIVSISSKSSSSVSCIVQDVFRYNTYRASGGSGNGAPVTGNYVVFSLSEAGLPVIDNPGITSGFGTTFLSTLISRFQYINLQNNYVFQQPDGSSVSPGLSGLNGGSGYDSGGSGVFLNVPLTGGSGTGALANITVTSGIVTAVQLTYAGHVTTSGIPYAVGDLLSASNANLGGTGAGFSITVEFIFGYGDAVAVDPSTGKFVLADSTRLNVVGVVTAVDDTGCNFSIDAIQKIDDLLNYLPGTVGDLIYTDPSNPGGLTTTPGGTEVYLLLRQNTQSTTTSSTFASPTTVVSSSGTTFNINGYLTTVGGTGTLTDINTAINAVSSSTGVSSVVAGSGSAYFLQVTAVDARAIAFEDVSGGTVSLSGLISVENGVKAAGMFITNARNSTSFASVIGYTFTQSSPTTTWTINHNGNTANYIAQVFGPILSISNLIGGSFYTDGTYLNVALTGGTGSGATANIVVSGGTVTSVNFVENGFGYVTTDDLTAPNSSIGGTGSGFQITIVATNEAILPDVISTVDVNNVKVTFADNQAGTAQLSLFVPQPA